MDIDPEWALIGVAAIKMLETITVAWIKSRSTKNEKGPGATGPDSATTEVQQ